MSKKIDIVPTAQNVSTPIIKNRTIIVIDVLRATSVIATALNNGALSVYVASTPDEAFSLKQKINNCLLGGERNADKIEGFDLDNSPLKYTREIVQNKNIILTTTNGTLALSKCTEATKIFVASFLNIEATLEKLRNQKNDITIVCSGTEGNFSFEDTLCAGLLSYQLLKFENYELSDYAQYVSKISNYAMSDLKNFASQSSHYKRLISKGYSADIDFCFDLSKQMPAVEFINNRCIRCE